MKSSIIIGLGYGDEGKGLTTDYLCSLNPEESKLVVRFSGGHQAGHTVQLEDGTRHVFSNFGSGTLRGVPTYWHRECTFDPVGVKNELVTLMKLGVKPTLYVNRHCPVVTPYDKGNQQINPTNKAHGTCGVGFGTTLQREEDHFHLNVFDLNYTSVLKERLNLIAQEYYRFKPSHDEFMTAVAFIKSYDSIHFVDNMYEHQVDHYIFEGSQGLLLDKDIGFFPHVTRSNVGTDNIWFAMQALNLSLYQGETNVYFITRAYTTRHGNGPVNDKKVNLVDDIVETNQFNEYQRDFRKRVLDVDSMNYGLSKMIHNDALEPHWNINFVITCMDHLKSYELVKHDCVFAYSDKKEFINSIVSSFEITPHKVFTNNSPVGKLNLVV